MGEADGGRAAVPRAGQGGKGLLRSYLAKTTGLSRAQVTGLIGQYLATEKVEEKGYSRRRFPSRYTAGHRVAGRSR